MPETDAQACLLINKRLPCDDRKQVVLCAARSLIDVFDYESLIRLNHRRCDNLFERSAWLGQIQNCDRLSTVQLAADFNRKRFLTQSRFPYQQEHTDRRQRSTGRAL